MAGKLVFSPSMMHLLMEIFMFETRMEMGSKLNIRGPEKGSGVKIPQLVRNFGVNAVWFSYGA